MAAIDATRWSYLLKEYIDVHLVKYHTQYKNNVLTDSENDLKQSYPIKNNIVLLKITSEQSSSLYSVIC